MTNLEYYLDRERDTLTAYDRESEFFAFFDKAAGVWKLFLIPFLRFLHDCFPEKNKRTSGGKTLRRLSSLYSVRRIYRDDKGKSGIKTQSKSRLKRFSFNF